MTDAESDWDAEGWDRLGDLIDGGSMRDCGPDSFREEGLDMSARKLRDELDLITKSNGTFWVFDSDIGEFVHVPTLKVAQEIYLNLWGHVDADDVREIIARLQWLTYTPDEEIHAEEVRRRRDARTEAEPERGVA